MVSYFSLTANQLHRRTYERNGETAAFSSSSSPIHRSLAVSMRFASVVRRDVSQPIGKNHRLQNDNAEKNKQTHLAFSSVLFLHVDHMMFARRHPRFWL
jgi:hypothetical protein